MNSISFKMEAVSGLRGWRAFYRFDAAVGRGDAALVTEMVAARPEWATAPSGDTGETAVHVSAGSGDVGVLRALLAAKASPSTPGAHEDDLPIGRAVRRGTRDTTALLLEAGAEVRGCVAAAAARCERGDAEGWAVLLTLLRGGAAADPGDAAGAATVALLGSWHADWARPWAVQRHHTAPRALRAAVWAALCCGGRVEGARLPPELWLAVLELLHPTDFLWPTSTS